MKAIVIYEPGGPEQLIYIDVPTPDAKPGWSLVKVQGFGINHSEIYARKGQSPSVRFPRILGIECVGVIEQSDVFPKGQQIISIMGEMGRAFDGGYAEYVLLPDAQIYPVETNLPLPQLAALPETYYTAYNSMRNLKLMPADRVLVRGATSGVGIAFLKLVKAKYPDMFVAGTSRSAKKAQRLLDEGFDDVVLDENNVLQTTQAYNKVLDLIGPAALLDTFSHMAEGSIVCCTGLLGGVWALNSFDPLEMLPPDAYLCACHSGHVTKEKIQAMLDYVRKYRVEVHAEKVFSLPEVPQAHAYLESGHSFGKVVVLLDR